MAAVGGGGQLLVRTTDGSAGLWGAGASFFFYSFLDHRDLHSFPTRRSSDLARVFAVADALDAMTSDRPYRTAGTWEQAAHEIAQEAGHQFDPQVVEAFRGRDSRLRRIHYELAPN